MSHNPFFENLKTGDSLPKGNPLGISCHFDTIQDVCDYEENDPVLLNKMQSGYPRFFCHPYETQLKESLAKEHDKKPEEIFLFSSETGAKQAIQTLGLNCSFLKKGSISYIIYSDIHNDLKLFIQHSGTKAYPRQISDCLKDKIHIKNDFYENSIKEELLKLYNIIGAPCSLHNSGMNAIFSVFEAIKKRDASRPLFVSYGWLYLDIGAILRKYSTEYVEFINISALEELKKLVDERGEEIAAVFTEVPTNPHLQTADLEALKAMLNPKDIFLVIDSTFGTPININVTPHADFIVESLSKFAGGHADILGGACIAVAERSKMLSTSVKKEQTTFYTEDAKILSKHIKGYKKRVERIRTNVPYLVQFFESNPKIKKVYWSHSKENIINYKKIELEPNAYSGVISIEFFDEEAFIKFYDKLKLPKGPSLGTEFTLIMPYFYMAHYEEILDGSLIKKGVNPYLLRISIGVEPVGEIIKRFEEALH